MTPGWCSVRRADAGGERRGRTDLASFSATLAAARRARHRAAQIADAQVTVVGDDALTFDASNWNVPQLGGAAP
ncbi:MAG: hypothetical protein R2838_05245 [Caldilineaceae bacterium]